MPDTEKPSSCGYELFPRADVGALTSFRVPARATLLAELYEAAALGDLLEAKEVVRAGSSFVLGGGSNILFTRDYAGLVLRVATRGIEVIDETEACARLRVAAGENWDRFVRWTLAQGFVGLENLILIPGTAGAAPIQNIGAYGVEIAEFLCAVRAWDRERRGFVTLDAGDCGFAYRDSRLKREPDRHIITAIELELPRARALRLDYAGLSEALETMDVKEPTHADVARAVERLRRRKLPDPAEIGNAGSFFKNPLVPRARAETLKNANPDLPVYPTGEEGTAKLSAAWLIEAAGFKGRREGATGVSDKHALVLVNYGGATGAEILALAERIRAAVAERFGVALEPEPKVL